MEKKVLSDYWDYSFEGFQTLEYYESNLTEIPNERGVYIILADKISDFIFKPESCAGTFRGLNPTVSCEFLESNWVKGTNVLFVGQAGRKMKQITLRMKIQRLLLFGRGKDVPHFQGRFIWQLGNPFKLRLAWTVIGANEEIPTTNSLITKFLEAHNKAPFANLSCHKTNEVYQYNVRSKIADDFEDSFLSMFNM